MIDDTNVCRSRRLQSAVDIGIAVVIAVLLWPFPMARRLLSPFAHVAGVLLTCVIAQFAYYAVSAAVWHTTAGLRLAGLRLETAEGQPPTRGQASLWGLISALLAWWYVFSPQAACRAALAERSSRVLAVPVDSDGE